MISSVDLPRRKPVILLLCSNSALESLTAAGVSSMEVRASGSDFRWELAGAIKKSPLAPILELDFGKRRKSFLKSVRWTVMDRLKKISPFGKETYGKSRGREEYGEGGTSHGVEGERVRDLWRFGARGGRKECKLLI